LQSGNVTACLQTLACLPSRVQDDLTGSFRFCHISCRATHATMTFSTITANTVKYSSFLVKLLPASRVRFLHRSSLQYFVSFMTRILLVMPFAPTYSFQRVLKCAQSSLVLNALIVGRITLSTFVVVAFVAEACGWM